MRKRILFCNAFMFLILVGCLFTTVLSASPGSELQILKGPYLQAATETSMRILWESNIPAEFKLEYYTDESHRKTEIIQPPKKTEGLNLYDVELAGLKPDTVYHYRVSSGSVSSENLIFKTFPKKNKPYKFAVVTDIHLCKSGRLFAERMLDFKPDFILDCGDIPEGYGFQYDIFESCYFSPLSKIAGLFPVYHARGNHDIGNYWDTFFMSQANGEGNNSPKTGRWYSFNAGNAHFIALDSNMYIPAVFEKEWKSEYKWLIEDLKSDVSKNATWRFIFQHHPYEYEKVREYIVPLMEKYNVNFLFAGHTHVYDRIVSINPEIGAGNIFITCGTMTEQGGDVKFGPKPLLKGYPNAVATGKIEYLTVEVNGDVLKIQAHTTLPGIGKDPDGILDEFTVAKGKSKFKYSDLKIYPTDIKAGEKIRIDVKVKNIGKGIGAVALNLLDNNRKETIYVIDSGKQQEVTVLNPGETKTVKAELPLFEQGRHTIRFENFMPVDVMVKPISAKFVYDNIIVKRGGGDKTDIVYVSVNVQNRGSFSKKSDVKLFIDGRIAAIKKVKLLPWEKKSFTFIYKFKTSGIHKVRVGNSADKSIEIPGSLMLTPIVKDMSGKENNGILRGHPLLVKGKFGTAVDLDGKRDYVEIPDSKSLHSDKFTAVVWANVDRLAKAGEADHNPLLGKGKSFGWGANYYLRMVYRNTGGTTFGTCFGNVEFAWEGGELLLNKWAQYVSTYNGSTGKGYIDGKQVAESSNGGKPLNYFEGYPLMSGLGYMMDVDPVLGRGTYPTHLDGKIGGIRMYNTCLTDDDINRIYDNPTDKGPQSNSLTVWLNFNDILKKGTHTTQWRKPVKIKQSYIDEKYSWQWKTLDVCADIPYGSGIKAVVQVSDNGRDIKGFKTIILENGSKKYSLSDLPDAEYIRIVSMFESAVTDSRIPIPKLTSYTVDAGMRGCNVQLSWETQVDWQRGTMTYAVGFEPLDRFIVGEY